MVGAERRKELRVTRGAEGDESVDAPELDPYCPPSPVPTLEQPMTPATAVRYQVRASFVDAATADRFVAWMRAEHGDELLAVPGCLEYRVYRRDELAVDAEYLFTDAAALETYLDTQAPALRAKGRERFPAELADFTRAVAPLVAEGRWAG